MKLLLTPLEKALKQLRTSLDYADSALAKKDAALREQFRSASIQAFEFSYEMAVKMIRRQLAQSAANPQELAQLSFADLIRSAADAGLLEDVKRFIVYRDARNRTSHAYEGKTAEAVFEIIPDFYRDAVFLLEQLRRRNS